jgi:tetratricopeptide (TPR) repeat protein
MKDIFAIEEEISQEITENLRLKLTGAQKKQLAQRYTENTEAYQLYLKGRYHWNKRTQEGITKGVEFFDKAIALDPNYALAYAGLADSYNLLASYSTMSPRTAFLRAKATAMRALKLDPNLAETNASLAHIRFWYEWDWKGAERDFKKALELNPSYGTAHLWYALYLIAMERVDEAIAEVKLAQELDPLSLVINLNVSRVLYFAREYDQAAEQCLKTLEMYPNFFLGHRRLGQIYERKQMYAEALAQFEKAIALSANNSETMSVKGYTLAAAGRTAEAEQVFEELKELAQQIYVSPYSLSRVLFGLGRDDEAFEYLEKTYQERHGILVYLKVEPLFDNLRSDPRLISMLERLNLMD